MQYGRDISTHGIFVQSGPWSSSSEDCPSSSFSRDAPVFGAAVGNAKLSSIAMSLRQASSTKAMDNGAEASVGCRSSSGEERKVTPVPTAETRDAPRHPCGPPLTLTPVLHLHSASVSQLSYAPEGIRHIPQECRAQTRPRFTSPWWCVGVLRILYRLSRYLPNSRV